MFSLALHLPQYAGDSLCKRSVCALRLICFIGSQASLTEPLIPCQLSLFVLCIVHLSWNV